MTKASPALAGAVLFIGYVNGATADGPSDLKARLEAEKEARKACKIEICKAFAAPQSDGAPIICDVTKTWLKDEITGRITGGDWVWSYGNMQCSLKLNLNRADIAKAFGAGKGEIKLSEHIATCNVDDKDPAKGKAFSVKLSVTPAITFDKGKATAVRLEPVKTEGSAIASAAVTSMMAVDKVSGIVSRAAAGETNTFIYSKCASDGVDVKAH